MTDFAGRKIIVLLGGNILNSGIFEYCKIHDYFVVVVDWSPNAALKGDLFLCIDVKDSKSIIDALEENGIKQILGAYTSIDLAVQSVNAINKHFNLESMNEDALANALPKASMTRIWQENNLLNRYSKVFCEVDGEIEDQVQKKKMIFKPNISSSSRGITITDQGSSINEIKEAFIKAKKESFDNKVIVEEFVEGREFTCEMIGDKYGNVSVYAISVKYHTEHTCKNKIAVKLHYNSDYYDDVVYEKIAEIGKKCYKALGFSTSFGHLEIMLKEDGTLSPIEIGARSSGYITNPLVSIASNQDFFGTYLSVLNGGKVTGDDYINGSRSSMYFFYDMPNGTEVVNPCSICDFLPNEIESIYNNRTKLQEKGFTFNNITNDNERFGFEILSGERHVMNIHSIEKAEKDFVLFNTGKNEIL